MPNKKTGLRTGAVLRLVMEDYGISRSDIATMTFSSESSVDKWLSGTNRMPAHIIQKITGPLKLPDSIFKQSVQKMMNPVSSVLSDKSIIIKNTTGFQIIVDLTHQRLKALIHFAGDMAADHALAVSDNDPQTDDDHRSD